MVLLIATIRIFFYSTNFIKQYYSVLRQFNNVFTVFGRGFIIMFAIILKEGIEIPHDVTHYLMPTMYWNGVTH